MERHLPNRHKALGSIPSATKKKVEWGGKSPIKERTRAQVKVWASLDYSTKTEKATVSSNER